MKGEKSLPAGRQAVVLLSGGLDSATTLYFAKNEGFKCFCLIFDYGQRHKREIDSAKRIAKAAHCPYQIIKLNFPWKGSALLDKKINIVTGLSLDSARDRQGHKATSKIPATYVPARNIIFLSFALSCAEAISAKAIFIGSHAQDYSGYPDCRPEFYRAFKKVISCGTKAGVEKKRIKIHTPLIHKSKARIIKLGLKLGVPFALTWSCYQGGIRPCGECDSCYFRAKGFKEAGLNDPARGTLSKPIARVSPF
jgi:7-cyano-7-deazaguanine synthase